MNNTIACLFFILLSFFSLDASADFKASVYVSLTCEGDSVGERIGYKIKEGIRGSQSMELAGEYIKSTVQLTIICKEPSAEDRGTSSTYSSTITALNTRGLFDYLLSVSIHECGTTRVAECAESAVASIDEEIGHLMTAKKAGTFERDRTLPQ